jgi:hypothetical protein
MLPNRTDYLIEVPTAPANNTDLVYLIASEIKAGVWAVFLFSLVLGFVLRKRVNEGLSHHFALMRTMTEAIEVNAANQSKNADSQSKLADTLREMEHTDQVTRADIVALHEKVDQILEYQTGLPVRSVRQSRITRYGYPAMTHPAVLDEGSIVEPQSESH